MTKDPIKAMEMCIGAVIEGLEVDTEAEIVIIKLNKGVIELEGESLEMYINIDEMDS
jgi:intracellular sulfur oxidation DsrE/DsrF family protein